jgi:predicted GH43/DUF377 family glycosyl hydrolase
VRRVLLALTLAGCPRGGGPEDTLVLDADVVDECAGACLVASGAAAVRIVSDVDGVLFDGETADGRACTGPMTPGAHVLTVTSGKKTLGTLSVTVKPFGYAYGLDKTSQLDAIPWVPEVEGLDETFVLDVGAAGEWDSDAVMAPGVVEWGGDTWMFYAGTAEEHFALGLAVDSGDGFVKREDHVLSWGEPGEVDGWKSYSQNTPEPEIVGDELWLWYNGQREPTGKLGIGLARSSDGLSWVDEPANPLLSGTGDGDDWDGIGVAHPSIVQRDGVYEMWYASGSVFAVGYAVSEDGVAWERYCRNPVFQGNGDDSWDQGHIKAPEVVWDGESYFMSYSGCDKGCYQVGWAASADGLRWLAHPDPILPAQGAGAWNGQATREAFVRVVGDLWTFWYTGNDGEHERIGKATARR